MSFQICNLYTAPLLLITKITAITAYAAGF